MPIALFTMKDSMFFFSSRRRHTRWSCDWSSDVCSSDLVICNMMTKWGETHGFVASDMVKELLRYSGLKKFDYAICNTAPLDARLITAYEQEKKYPMKCDDALSAYTEHVITGDFFSEADIARHDPEKIAKIISSL